MVQLICSWASIEYERYITALPAALRAAEGLPPSYILGMSKDASRGLSALTGVSLMKWLSGSATLARFVESNTLGTSPRVGDVSI